MKFDSVDPSVAYNYSIGIAARNGNLNLVKLFLNDKRVNPSDRYNEAHRIAYKCKHYEISALLFNDLRVKEYIKEDNPDFYHHLMKIEVDYKINLF